MKKILFIATHRPNRSPGQRFRFEQYFKYLQEHGFECELSYIITEHDDKVFYSKGNFLKKAIILLKSYRKRMADLKRAKNFDIIFIFREANITGTTLFERKLKRYDARMVFDFDDAIWLQDVSEGNKKLAWLKDPSKTPKLIALSDLTIAGNQYLADYASQYSNQVQVIPTTIDTTYHQRQQSLPEKETICIGWTGSHTTTKYFDLAVPVLKRLKAKYGNKVSFKLIGDGAYYNEALKLQGVPWQLDREIEELLDLDIGIMPLPNDDWAKGKCGFKGLQYMALEIPTVMSPIGVNTEIIEHGVNGFLAETEDEWVEVLSELIESHALRIQVGKAGRGTVEERYSVNANKEKYLACFRTLILD